MVVASMARSLSSNHLMKLQKFLKFLVFHALPPPFMILQPVTCQPTTLNKPLLAFLGERERERHTLGRKEEDEKSQIDRLEGHNCSRLIAFLLFCWGRECCGYGGRLSLLFLDVEFGIWPWEGCNTTGVGGAALIVIKKVAFGKRHLKHSGDIVDRSERRYYCL